jgi:hypothetical protein
MRINGIEENSSLTLTEWHGINADLVRWIAGEILAASDDNDLSNLNIEEYKFIEHPKKDGVKTALKPDNERKGLPFFKNIESKNTGRTRSGQWPRKCLRVNSRREYPASSWKSPCPPTGTKISPSWSSGPTPRGRPP